MASLAPSRLLRGAFDVPSDPHNGCDRLKASYISFKERSALLAKEIARDFPELTVHDQSHLDALWELADLVTQPTFRLNPLEAYVLGGAILIHDLGLAVAAYPGGREHLRSEPEWRDALSSALERELQRPAKRVDLANPSQEAVCEAEKLVLRQRHAAQAERLASLSWKADNVELFLIEDAELRELVGPLIGQLAHSHWWDTAVLPEVFDRPLGSPAWCPAEWTAAPLPLACLLRVCDALHLDARRAPLFLRAIREPLPDQSKAHWKFQERLARPYLKGDRLVFTSGKSFDRDDADAWWLCYDTLSYAHRMIGEVRGVLADSDLPELAVHGIIGVDDPARFAKFVPTADWIPVDTHVQVSNVADLVLKLGGEELYGRDRPEVALRELIQNAADAVRVRRIVQELPRDWGHVSVRLTEEAGDHWLVVSDSGIGMNQERLTGSLLDFGQSYWSSGAVTREFPGLLSSGFEAAGRFGIGFFSVFMLGSKVEVISRPYDGALSDTKKLVFSEGVAKRPILSEAEVPEHLPDGGTAVKIRLSEGVHSQLLDDRGEGDWDLHTLCTWLCPTLDVTLQAESKDALKIAVEADDWLRLDGIELFNRNLWGQQEKATVPPLVQHAADHLEVIHDSEGKPIARISILPTFHSLGSGGRQGYDGVVTAGGFRASSLNGIGGVLIGEPNTASRDSATPVIERGSLASWATRQAERLEQARNDYLVPDALAACASVVMACGGDPRSLPICQIGNRWVDLDELKEWVQDKSEIVVIEHDQLDYQERHFGTIELAPNVIKVQGSYASLVTGEFLGGLYYEASWPEVLSVGAEWEVIDQHILSCVAEVWQAAPEKIVDVSHLSADGALLRVGTRGAEEVEVREADLLRRPVAGA